MDQSLTHGAVGGIFNLAVLLHDSILENQSVDKFHEAFGPKVFATRYLDELSRVLCPNLRHFVVFSSAACGRGNAGQTNYGMANSIIERIIENRVRDNLPGKVIQWVSRMEEKNSIYKSNELNLQIDMMHFVSRELWVMLVL